jgi:hypothetical protein
MLKPYEMIWMSSFLGTQAIIVAARTNDPLDRFSTELAPCGSMLSGRILPGRKN